MLDDLKIFITVVKHSNLTQAAKQLGLSTATVSRRLNALEMQLNTPLLHRGSRHITLTREGAIYFDECASLLERLDNKLHTVDLTLNQLQGQLGILAPANLANGPLADFWPLFIQQYPDIHCHIDVDNRMIDLHQSRADIAIRVGKMPDSDLIQKQLGHINTLLICASGQPVPEQITDLESFHRVVTPLLPDWPLYHLPSNQQLTLSTPAVHSSNDLAVASQLLAGGKHVALLPHSQAAKALDSGELVHILPQWQGPARPVYLIWPQRRFISARVEAFTQALQKFLQKQSWFTPL